MDKRCTPHSPLTTRLSGSARETENRIRNIFQWKKKRPPALVLALAALVIVLCGSLVSCQEGTTFVSNVASGRVDQMALKDDLAEAAQTLFPSGVIQPTSVELMAFIPGDDGNVALGAVCVQTDRSESLLALGVQDQLTGQLTAPVFATICTGSQPHVVTFNKDGESYLLYVANSIHLGLTYGEAGLIRYDGTDFTWVWPVEGGVREEDSQARKDYEAYWQEYKALMAPGGVDIFAQTDNAVINGDGPQWVPDHNETFYPAPEDTLPIPVPWQVRNWLETFTHQDNNPLNANNTSALWSIQSLTQTELTSVELKNTQTAYTVLARADTDDTLWFTACLIYDRDENSLEVYDYTTGSLEEVTEYIESLVTLISGIDSQEFYTLAHQYYSQKYQGQTYYFAVDQPEVPQEGDLRLGSVSYNGSCHLPQGIGSAYTVSFSRYRSGEWASPRIQYLVLLRNEDGSFSSVLGEPSSYHENMSAYEIVHLAVDQAEK